MKYLKFSVVQWHSPMYSQVNEKNLSDRLSVADILSSMANGVEEPSTSVTVSLTSTLKK